MRARTGDWVVVHGRRVDDPVRRGRVLQVSEPDGGPPWVVRWTDDDRTSVVFPGSDTTLEHPAGTAP